MIVCGDRLDFKFSESIAKKIGATIFYPEIVVFADGEMRVSIHNGLVGKEVLLIKQYQSGDFNSEILKTAFIIDALKRSGAKKITGFFPYFPYVRSDHQKKTGEAVNLEVIARLFEGAGIDELITVDPHTAKFSEFFTIPVATLSTTLLFAEEIGKALKNKSFSLVTPDGGGIRLIQPLADIFRHAEIVKISKERYPDGSVLATDVDGQVEKICVIVDDIIATGGTIHEAIGILKKKGAREFYIFATHGVFSKNSSYNLDDPDIKKIFVCDSLLFDSDEIKNTKKLTLVDLLVSHIKTSSA